MSIPLLSKDVLQERDSLKPRPALIIILVVMAVGTGAVLIMWLYLGRMDSRLLQPEVPAQATRMGSDKSGVEQSIIRENRKAQTLGAEQEKHLRSWGWVDRDKGTIHIPVDRAFDLMLEEQKQ